MFLFLACALCAVGISHLVVFFFFFGCFTIHSVRQTKTWRQMMMGQGEMDQIAKTTPPGHSSSYM